MDVVKFITEGLKNWEEFLPGVESDEIKSQLVITRANYFEGMVSMAYIGDLISEEEKTFLYHEISKFQHRWEHLQSSQHDLKYII